MKILVFACDRYADAAPAWWHLFQKNWTDCPHDVVFVTRQTRLDVPCPVYYLDQKKDMAFGWRLRTFLREHYTEEHLLIHMVDYFIKQVDTDMVARAHELCAMPNIRHVRLRPMPAPQQPYPAPGFGMIDKYSRYSLSLQPGIWETRVLNDLSNDRENPFATEIQGSGRARRVDGVFLSSEEWILVHHNYYNKGKPQGLDWVRENVIQEAWPEALK